MSTASSLVVLVEPEAAICEALEASLRDAGFQVLATPDGEECLRIVEEESTRIDAVLAEAAMPGVGGREIAAVLAEYRPDMPVVLISSKPATPEIRILGGSPSAPLAVDVLNTAALVAQLRATIDRLATARQRLETAYAAAGALLEENRRLHAEHSSLLSAVRALAARRSPPACPRCAATRVAPILYGHERLHRLDELASGRVVLGGAHHTDGSPNWYCRECEHRW